MAENQNLDKNGNILRIYDANGNELKLTDIIYQFIKTRAEKHDKDIEEVFIGVDMKFPQGTPHCIYTTESRDNGYDGLDLCEFGEFIMMDEE